MQVYVGVAWYFVTAFRIRALREKRPYSEFFWSLFSRIVTEYGPKKLRIRTVGIINLVRIQLIEPTIEPC